jgi:hypothetical protein
MVAVVEVGCQRRRCGEHRPGAARESGVGVVERCFVGKRPRTSARLTTVGHATFDYRTRPTRALPCVAEWTLQLGDLNVCGSRRRQPWLPSGDSSKITAAASRGTASANVRQMATEPWLTHPSEADELSLWFIRNAPVVLRCCKSIVLTNESCLNHDPRRCRGDGLVAHRRNKPVVGWHRRSSSACSGAPASRGHATLRVASLRTTAPSGLLNTVYRAGRVMARGQLRLTSRRCVSTRQK